MKTANKEAMNHAGTGINEEFCQPPNLPKLVQGMTESGDCGNPPEPPKWLDKRLFEKGRQFCHKYQFCIFFSELLALMAGFSIQRLVVPLIFTRKSDTPTKAMQRYLSTLGHTVTWYQNDIWNPDDEGHRDLLRVRSIHKRVSERIKTCSKEHCLDLRDSDADSLICPISDLIREDLKWVRKVRYKLDMETEPVEYLSQLDMVLVQYAFSGFIFSHPRMMGLWWLTKDELDGFAHYWRGIGWLLGIDDAYNLCNGTTDQIKSLCLDIEQHIFVKSLSEVSHHFEKMSKSLMEGMNLFLPCVSFSPMLLYLMSVLNLHVPSLRQNTRWTHFFQYLLMRFVFTALFLVPRFIAFFNDLLQRAILRAKHPKGDFHKHTAKTNNTNSVLIERKLVELEGSVRKQNFHRKSYS